MGKYNFKVDGKMVTNTRAENDNAQLIYILNKIANELAEANRLKRLEMKVEFTERFHLKSFELTLKDLEDQA